MPEVNKLYWRPDRPQCRVGLDKGGIEAALKRRPNHVRIEYYEDVVVITDPRMAPWRERTATA